MEKVENEGFLWLHIAEEKNENQILNHMKHVIANMVISIDFCGIILTSSTRTKMKMRMFRLTDITVTSGERARYGALSKGMEVNV